MKESAIVDIERKAVEYLDNLRREAGLTEERLGEIAFPDVTNKRAKINALRAPRSNTGSPLRLKLGDFCAICHALKRNPAQELLLLWGEADTADSEQKQSPS